MTKRADELHDRLVLVDLPDGRLEAAEVLRYLRELERTVPDLPRRAAAVYHPWVAVRDPLGSIATPKYVEPLLGVFRERLLFPREFVGRGDMSRGGLLLRAVRAAEELHYVPIQGAVRHGPRAARLSGRR